MALRAAPVLEKPLLFQPLAPNLCGYSLAGGLGFPFCSKAEGLGPFSFWGQTMTLPEARRVFAELMREAREGTLTERARARLSQARQILRRAKRPAMNPTVRKERFSLYVQDTTGQSTFRGEFYTLPKAKKAALSFARSASYPLVEIYGQGGRIVWSSRGRLRSNPRSYYLIGDFHGSTVYYTGRAGRDFISGNFKEAFHYSSESEALRKVDVLNRMSRVHGVVFDMRAIHRPSTNPEKLTRGKARRILHEGVVRGRRLTPRQRRYFGARASGAPRRNPGRSMQRIGRAVEVRYKRDIGRSPGYYKHEIQSRKAGVYTIPPGWVYVGTKSILISESSPKIGG